MILLLLIFNIFLPCLSSKGLDVSPRISLGNEASSEDLPFIGYIHYGDTFQCAGNIIHSRWGLTAAHCLVLGKEPQAFFTAGTAYRNKSGTTFGIELFVPHPQFIHRNDDKGNLVYANDIGLFRLDKEIVYSKTLQHIELDGANVGHYGFSDKVLIAGWGGTGPSGNINLQYVVVDVLENKYCKTTWSFLRDDQICTDVHPHGFVCPGDSGGPVVKGYKLIGIIVYGDNNCDPYRPAVHTKVASYIQWIKDSIYRSGDTLQ